MKVHIDREADALSIRLNETETQTLHFATA